MPREPVQPSDAEWKVLHALWRRHPATAREVQSELADVGWAYTTVKTMLSRMEEKRLVRSRMVGNTASYSPAIEQKRAQNAAVKSMLERVFEGAAGPLLAFLTEHEKLSPEERRALLDRLEKLPRKDKEEPRER